MEGVFFIVGPTSAGKSALALQVAERTGGEIVNADAFQVYDGLDLLTSKPDTDARRRVRHHLLGTVGLGESYSVARYLAEATACLQEIASRGRLAIVVGGTGLYVKALTHGLSPLPASDPATRARLEAADLPDLLRELARVDPATAERIDVKNKRRVVRALEVTLTTGTPFSASRDAWTHSKYEDGRAGLYLERNRDDLRARIDRQVDGMFEAGVVAEVRGLAPGSIGPTAAGAIGLNTIQEVFAGRVSEAECRERVKISTRQYATRQTTWFKKEAVFQRFYLSADGDAFEQIVSSRGMPPW